MNTSIRRRRRAILMALCGLATACAPAAPDDSTPSSPAPAEIVAREVGDPSAARSARATAVDAESMVVAADLIVSGGDLDQAIADGAVTAVDVAAARVALADGSLADLFD